MIFLFIVALFKASSYNLLNVADRTANNNYNQHRYGSGGSGQSNEFSRSALLYTIIGAATCGTFLAVIFLRMRNFFCFFIF
jgi:hypothetical protein